MEGGPSDWGRGLTMKQSLALAFLAAAALAGCRSQQSTTAGQGTEIGIEPSWMDTSVRPGDDFNLYANGHWIASHAIPEDRSEIGASYLADLQREKNTRELFDGILKANPTSGNNALIANYYKAYLNTDAMDRAGMAPAKADLDAIARISDKTQLSAAIGSTLRADTDPLNATNFQTENLFGIFVTQGLSTPGETLPYLMQGGIGLPEREYYLSGDSKMAGLRGQYRTYVATVLKAAGVADAAAAAGRILDLETKIARAHA